MRSFAHPVIRRSILALAITQLVMSSLAPLHDLGANIDRGAARIERGQTPADIPVHNPDTCPVCQLLTAQLIRPEETRITPSTGSVQRPASVDRHAGRPRTTHRTPAPRPPTPPRLNGPARTPRLGNTLRSRSFVT